MTLMDDGYHEQPTFSNIMSAFDWIVRQSQPGDTVWIHYSGHGGRLEDQDGDEEDGYDETLIPVDFQSAGKFNITVVIVRKVTTNGFNSFLFPCFFSTGQIRDDDLLKHLVKAMPQGVLMTCLMDCCHSGTVLDLPYNFIAE